MNEYSLLCLEDC